MFGRKLVHIPVIAGMHHSGYHDRLPFVMVYLDQRPLTSSETKRPQRPHDIKANKERGCTALQRQNELHCRTTSLCNLCKIPIDTLTSRCLRDGLGQGFPTGSGELVQGTAIADLLTLEAVMHGQPFLLTHTASA